MSYYRIGDSFKWFVARVIDIKDPKKLGRVKIRVIHEQTGELGKKVKSYGITDDDLLWAWPISAVQSASLSWKKVVEMEGYPVPEWIEAVGLSPTGIAVSTYVFGYYLDGLEENIPVIFGTYHKESRYPEPPTDTATGEMLQIEPPQGPQYFYSDLSALARGEYKDEEAQLSGPGQTLPKDPYTVNTLWGKPPKEAPVDEMPSAYATEYPYNLTYTTKSGHAIELDDTIGHERIHIWHQSGCYEEISNGPLNPALADADRGNENYVYPEGSEEYQYHTAGGVVEPAWKGRRSHKTIDSSFEVVGKDKNEHFLRDHNKEIANTQMVKIGKTMYWTVGHATPPGNRVNDNLQTDYEAGNLSEFNAYIDVSNNTTQTTGNNYQLQIGFIPDGERRLRDKGDIVDKFNYLIDVANNVEQTTGNNFNLAVGYGQKGERDLLKEDEFNYITDVANNSVMTSANNSQRWVGYGKGSRVQLGEFEDRTDVANNQYLNVGNNQTTTISNNQTTSIGNNQVITIANNQNVSVGANCVVAIADNCTITVGQNCTITVQGNVNVSASGTLDMSSQGAMNISSSASITMNAPSININ